MKDDDRSAPEPNAGFGCDDCADAETSVDWPNVKPPALVPVRLVPVPAVRAELVAVAPRENAGAAVAVALLTAEPKLNPACAEGAETAEPKVNAEDA